MSVPELLPHSSDTSLCTCEALILSLPVLRHAIPEDDTIRMLTLGCWEELERVQLLPAQWPLHQHEVWCETYSRATALPWETAEHPPVCKAPRNPSAPFDIPVLPLARHIPPHLCACQALCDSCSSQVQQSCQFPSDITVVLMFWCSPASVALAGFDKWSYWCEEENRWFALFSSKQWCYFYRMTRQESKILPNLRALTCSSSSAWLLF